VIVFQRALSSINVRNNRPTSPDFSSTLKPGWQTQRKENFNAILAGSPEEDLVSDGWTASTMMAVVSSANIIDPEKLGEMMAAADFRTMERIRARVEEVVKDAKTAG
jgi:hypothetical protein